MSLAIAPSAAGPHARCPSCNNDTAEVLVPSFQIRRQIDWRSAFAWSRFARFRAAKPIKDLDDIAYSAPADLLLCRACAIVVRSDSAESDRFWENDRYDEVELRAIFDAHLRDFETIAGRIRPLLRDGANVVEIGSYVGAFLAITPRWRWIARGVDVGRDASRFANERGCETMRTTFAGASFATSSFDGVFVWNCFEQVPDPTSLLREVRRTLKPRGILVVRTPHCGFYTLCSDLIAASADVTLSAPALRLLAYSNLLGFPYSHGFTPDSLRRLVEAAGFVEREHVTRFPSIFPRPGATRAIVEEECATRELAGRIQSATDLAPWFESVFERA